MKTRRVAGLVLLSFALQVSAYSEDTTFKSTSGTIPYTGTIATSATGSTSIASGTVVANNLYNSTQPVSILATSSTTTIAPQTSQTAPTPQTVSSSPPPAQENTSPAVSSSGSTVTVTSDPASNPLPAQNTKNQPVNQNANNVNSAVTVDGIEIMGRPADSDPVKDKSTSIKDSQGRDVIERIEFFDKDDKKVGVWLFNFATRKIEQFSISRPLGQETTTYMGSIAMPDRLRTPAEKDAVKVYEELKKLAEELNKLSGSWIDRLKDIVSSIDHDALMLQNGGISPDEAYKRHQDLLGKYNDLLKEIDDKSKAYQDRLKEFNAFLDQVPSQETRSKMKADVATLLKMEGVNQVKTIVEQKMKELASRVEDLRSGAMQAAKEAAENVLAKGKVLETEGKKILDEIKDIERQVYDMEMAKMMSGKVDGVKRIQLENRLEQLKDKWNGYYDDFKNARNNLNDKLGQLKYAAHRDAVAKSIQAAVMLIEIGIIRDVDFYLKNLTSRFAPLR